MSRFSGTASITNIYHLSSHDGPGARTTLFFKGCSLRCAWCHNPETIALKQQIMWRRELCIGCGECMKGCPSGALKLGSELSFVDRELCIGCSQCVEVCPSKALRLASKSYTIEQMAELIRKDSALFLSMRGGVTFSGGEPALHSDFILSLIDELADPRITFALDSCGQVPFESYERLIPKMSHLLFDIKELDEERHRRFTGSGNSQILSNLTRIIELIERDGLETKIWIRTPLIPHYTATRENIEAIAHLLSGLPKEIVERWECCCFNNMCADKYRQMGHDWPLKELDLMEGEQAQEFLQIAKAIAPNMDIRVMGLTKRG